MTLLELTIATATLLVALMILGGAIGATSKQRVILSENAIAREAARNMLETLRSEEFARIYASYDADPTDDPDGPGTAPGDRFEVAGLDPLPGMPGGLQGQIQFPVADLPGGWELREDIVDNDLGMPRDLDGDGIIDAENHAGDYFLLPVRVRIRWQGHTGPRVQDTCVQLCEFNAL